jgi:hypothetical protein
MDARAVTEVSLGRLWWDARQDLLISGSLRRLLDDDASACLIPDRIVGTFVPARWQGVMGSGWLGLLGRLKLLGW